MNGVMNGFWFQFDEEKVSSALICFKDSLQVSVFQFVCDGQQFSAGLELFHLKVRINDAKYLF
jgi:hypothetical protein